MQIVQENSSNLFKDFLCTKESIVGDTKMT